MDAWNAWLTVYGSNVSVLLPQSQYSLLFPSLSFVSWICFLHSQCFFQDCRSIPHSQCFFQGCRGIPPLEFVISKSSFKLEEYRTCTFILNSLISYCFFPISCLLLQYSSISAFYSEIPSSHSPFLILIFALSLHILFCFFSLSLGTLHSYTYQGEFETFVGGDI